MSYYQKKYQKYKSLYLGLREVVNKQEGGVKRVIIILRSNTAFGVLPDDRAYRSLLERLPGELMKLYSWMFRIHLI